MLFKGRVSLFWISVSWAECWYQQNKNMGPLPALMIDYDTGIKKKASPVKYYWHRNQSVAEAAVWFQWGGEYLLVYCLFEFQLPVLFTEFSHILLSINGKNFKQFGLFLLHKKLTWPLAGPESTLLSRSISALFFAVLRNFWCHPSIPNTMLVVEGAAGP